MRYLSLIIAFFSISTCHIEAFSRFNENQRFIVQEKQYQFSTYFEMDGKNCPIGTVVKSAFRLRTNYDLYGPKGQYEGVGIVRPFGSFGLGALYSWATDIDVYDPDGHVIGMIDGEAATSEAAKFKLFDGDGHLCGIAYMDRTISGFTIYHPSNQNFRIAVFSRQFIKDQIDKWEVVVYDPDIVDPRIIKIFAAFAVDHQEFFKEDN